jgi:hypothetical protein
VITAIRNIRSDCGQPMHTPFNKELRGKRTEQGILRSSLFGKFLQRNGALGGDVLENTHFH